MTDKQMIAKLRLLKSSAREIRLFSTVKKNLVLEAAAYLLLEREEKILAANEKDIEALKKTGGSKKGAASAFLDRLKLDSERINHMVKSLRQVAALPDPVGELLGGKALKNGLELRRVRCPLGVIFLIFESRPNVAIEAFSLAFKAGNCLILKGGSESLATTKALYKVLEDALETEGAPKSAIWGVDSADRKITDFLLTQHRWIDVVVPRGGQTLMEYVSKNSEIPIIKNDRGLCHIYVHEDADTAMAGKIITNAKIQRPGVCNSVETILVHEKIAAQFLPRLHTHLQIKNVQWFVCPKTYAILKDRAGVKKATQKSWDTEYLDLKINCKVVSSIEEAIVHIEDHGTQHSEAIITRSDKIAQKFQAEVDAAVVYWNASTRFTDGYQMGLGGELGISTQKLHVRGPVGLRELTSVRWLVNGTGQIRG
jgi:glutamate-5-semialdehyde dehydrogenase